jgi:flagellar assembly factor FliW
MHIDTKRFGSITINEDELFSLPAGIPGFATVRRAALLGAEPMADGEMTEMETEQAMYWLQDADDGDLAFLCMVPWDVFPAYDLDIDEAELGIDEHDDVRVLNLLTVRRSEAGNTVTANLRAPIVIDVRRRQLFQVILNDARWPIDQPVAAVPAPGMT